MDRVRRVNFEHSLNASTDLDADIDNVLDSCANSKHLYLHKIQYAVLGPGVERLSERHRPKPRRLYRLSWFFDSLEMEWNENAL